MPRILVDVARSAEERALAMSIWRAANAARSRPSGDVRAGRIEQKLEQAELLLIAHYGDRPAGMLLAEAYVEDGVRSADTGHLSMISVDPAVWGARVGTTLIRDLQQREWTRLSVWTRADNRRAHRLYRSTGFTASGQRTRLQDGEELVHYHWH